MKYYLSSSFENREMAHVASYLLNHNNFIHTYDWTQNEKAATFEELRFVGEKEREGILEADFFILFLPAGKTSHTELGMALALKKRIYIYSPNEDIYDLDKTSNLYFLPEVRPFVGQIADFIPFIIKSENNIVLLH